jgi:hypothetical protein
VYRSKSAAEQARESADKARRDIFRAIAMIDLTRATAAINDIKRLHREANWLALLERYSALRTTLITIRASRPDLAEQHKTTIQGIIAQIRTLETKVEGALPDGQNLNAAKLNKVISVQLDKLSQILGELRSDQNG